MGRKAVVSLPYVMEKVPLRMESLKQQGRKLSRDSTKVDAAAIGPWTGTQTGERAWVPLPSAAEGCYTGSK